MTTANDADIVEITAAQIPMAADRRVGWASLRDTAPVVKVGDLYWITRRDDVVKALKSPETFSSEKAFDQLGSPLPLVPIAFDPPEHTRFRKILQPFFSPRALGEILPALQAQAVGLIDSIVGRDECDAVAEVAIPYPSQVFLTFFGLPLEDSEQLIAWKDTVISFAGGDNLDDVDIQPAIDLMVYLDNTIRARRQNPGNDLLSNLLKGDSSVDLEPLDDGEALGLGFLFVLAGLDTVTATLGFALLELARNPELRASLAADPGLIPEFVEEIVRLEPPAPVVPRTTTREVEVAGVTLPKGTSVHLCLGAINRETGGSCPVPDEVLMDGKPHKHWGFGGGPHRCLGSHLARMELKLVIGEWLKRIPEFSLAPDADTDIPWPANVHGLKSLKLRLGKD